MMNDEAQSIPGGGKSDFVISVIVIVLFVSALSYCMKPREPDMSWVKPFPSMQACVDGIEKFEGKTLNIVQDKPGHVSGFINPGTKRFFVCERIVSEMKGVYIEGRWQQEKNK